MKNTGADGVDFFEIGGNGHLFVKLRRLGQIRRSFEVGHFENVGATFTSGRNDFRCVNLNEFLKID